LLDIAERFDTEVSLAVRVGDMLWEDEVVFNVSTQLSRDQDQGLLTGLEAGLERSFPQDPFFVFRLLNDIGLRATSPAISDPFTAVQVIDTIEGLLRRLLTRNLDVGLVADSGGRSRVRLSLPDWEEFLQAAIDELIDAGRGIVIVRRRLVTLLDHLIRLSPAGRAEALRRRLQQLADS